MHPFIISSSLVVFILYGAFLIQVSIILIVFLFIHKKIRQSSRKKLRAVIIASIISIAVFVITTSAAFAFRVFAYDIILIGDDAHQLLSRGSYVIIKQLSGDAIVTHGSFIAIHQETKNALQIAIVVALPGEHYYQEGKNLVLCDQSVQDKCTESIPSGSLVISYQSPFERTGPFEIISQERILSQIIMRR